MKQRMLIVALLMTAAATSLRGAQQPAFSTKIEAVRVDVLVTDGGGPLRGLAPADFELLDNGVPQQVDLVSFEQIPLNLVLALDMSASLPGERLDHLRTAGHAALAALEPVDRASLVTFSERVLLAAPLAHDLDAVQSAL